MKTAVTSRAAQLARSVRSLRSSPTARRLAITALWSAVGDSLSKGLLLISLVAVARILGKEGYGQFGLIRTTIGMFATVGGVGLGLTANRYVARFRITDPHYSGQIIGSSYLLASAFGALTGTILFLMSGYVARDTFGVPQLQPDLRLAALLLLLGAVNGAQIGILQGLEAYRRLALGATIQGVIALVSFITGAYYFALSGALGALLAYTLAGILIDHVLIHRELRQQSISVSYRGLNRVLPLFLGFSVPAALTGIAVAPFKWWSETMLAKTSGFQDLGVFHASMTTMNVFLALVSTLNAPLISLTANLQDKRDSPRLHYVNLYGSWYLFLLLACPLLLFPDIPSLLFGERYAGVEFRAVTLVMLLYCGLLVYYQGIMRVVAQYGSMWLGFFTNLCEGASLLAAFYLLSDERVLGLALAYTCSYLVRVIVTTPVLLRQKIVSPELLFDKYFAMTIGLLGALVFIQVVRLT